MGRRRSLEEMFAGRHFDREVIILCVRWYLRYKLSFRDLVEMMAERRLCGFASSCRRDAHRGPAPQANQAAFFKIPEQSHRAGPSRDQIQNLSYVGLQKLFLCCRYHRRSGATSSDPQGSILPQPSTPQRPRCACTLECSACCYLVRLIVLFAPEPKNSPSAPAARFLPPHWYFRSPQNSNHRSYLYQDQRTAEC